MRHIKLQRPIGNRRFAVLAVAKNYGIGFQIEISPQELTQYASGHNKARAVGAVYKAICPFALVGAETSGNFIDIRKISTQPSAPDVDFVGRQSRANGRGFPAIAHITRIRRAFAARQPRTITTWASSAALTHKHFPTATTLSAKMRPFGSKDRRAPAVLRPTRRPDTCRPSTTLHDQDLLALITRTYTSNNNDIHSARNRENTNTCSLTIRASYASPRAKTK